MCDVSFLLMAEPQAARRICGSFLVRHCDLVLISYLKVLRVRQDNPPTFGSSNIVRKRMVRSLSSLLLANTLLHLVLPT